ncbi:dna replication licensing factor mcm4 [Hordeum vulgare]|nr:dna replication licensing factor mcm4 [Hordeum vulgare]
MDKEKLAPLYIPGRGIVGSSKDLLSVYDIPHRVFHNVLLPKVGNQDEIHGYFVDLLVAMKEMAGTGPHLMLQNVRRPGEPLYSAKNLTEHDVKQLRKKKHVAPRFPDDAPEDVFATSSDSDFELPAAAKPSWVSKFSNKLKKTFCLQAHVQQKLYEAHDNEKLAQRRQIQIMRALKLEAANGFEKSIIPEEKWTYCHRSWIDD